MSELFCPIENVGIQYDAATGDWIFDFPAGFNYGGIIPNDLAGSGGAYGQSIAYTIYPGGFRGKVTGTSTTIYIGLQSYPGTADPSYKWLAYGSNFTDDVSSPSPKVFNNNLNGILEYCLLFSVTIWADGSRKHYTSYAQPHSLPDFRGGRELLNPKFRYYNSGVTGTLYLRLAVSNTAKRSSGSWSGTAGLTISDLSVSIPYSTTNGYVWLKYSLGRTPNALQLASLPTGGSNGDTAACIGKISTDSAGLITSLYGPLLHHTLYWG
jgi:hypothetical protein